MALFVGCIDRAAKEDRFVATQMLASLERRSPGGTCAEHLEGATFAAFGDEGCIQSAGSVAGKLFIGDIRLDNRREIELSLRCSADTLDGDLILLGFERWGEQFLDRICGDFAFAIWDARRRVLFAARDPFGVKTFYYAISESTGRILFSNDLEPLVGQVDRTALDSEMAIDYLLTSFRHHRRTFFRDVIRLQPGHFLTATERTHSQSRYFFPPSQESSLQKTGDYFEEFRRLLKVAVHDRLESRHPILAHLSGGIDSTSIVLLADEIYEADGRALRAPLTTASAVFPGLPCDESAIIAATRRRVRFPGETWIACDAKWENLRHPSVSWPGSPAPISGGSTGDLEIARRVGAKTILSGVGGDELSFATGVFRDLAASGRWVTLIRETIGCDRFSPSQKWKYLRDAPRGLVPRSIGRWRRRLAPMRRGSPPAWFGPSLRAAWPGVNERPRAEDDALDLNRTWTQRQTWNALTTVTAGVPADYRAHYAAEGGIEMRFPFLDRRLVTFVLSIPRQHRLPGGYMRRLQWQGLKERMPPEVLAPGRIISAESARRTEGQNAVPLYREIIEGREWRSGDWVDQGAARSLLRRTIDASKRGTDYVGDWQCLQRIATLEAWHRAVLSYTARVPAEGRSCH